MSEVNGYADLARFLGQAAAAQALAWRGMERVADLQWQAMEGQARAASGLIADAMTVAMQTATSFGTLAGPPARA
ncbi:hypothetical protein [Luteibacter yeojuensis]|uniref:Phasin protein n=1 Tax=Luteibacter yeojuensis TaxID=345309 RepID=A0A7X5QVR0_9GAMM|nr:hypothetical protein [Luteibacter yeojuensis]NID16301.1 hypothetical protein [Luteibacter yeojuensis]